MIYGHTNTPVRSAPGSPLWQSPNPRKSKPLCKREGEENEVDRETRPANEWKWRTAFGIAAMLGSGIVLYAVSAYGHNHPFHIDFIDTILESSPVTELAGSLIVIPVVYLLIQSGLDRKFKEEISETLHHFVAEPTSIIPHIEADKLDGFTSQLLNKVF